VSASSSSSTQEEQVEGVSYSTNINIQLGYIYVCFFLDIVLSYMNPMMKLTTITTVWRSLLKTAWCSARTRELSFVPPPPPPLPLGILTTHTLTDVPPQAHTSLTVSLINSHNYTT
jgi:hypothetical protein